jgi:hypothetical protein
MGMGSWEREWNRIYSGLRKEGIDNVRAAQLATERLQPTARPKQKLEPVECGGGSPPLHMETEFAAERIARNRAKLARFVRPWALAWMVWIALYWTVLGPQSTDLPNALGVLIASAWGGAAAVFIGRCVRALGRGRLWA